MNRSSMVLGVVAVLILASVGTGFALSYISTTTSRNNTVQYNGITLDIEDSHEIILSTPLSVVGPTTQQTEGNLTHISGGCSFTYYLKVNCPSNAYLQCWTVLNDAKTWAVIDSISLSIVIGGVTKMTEFTHDTSATLSTVSIPSESLQVSSGTYSFTVSIQYREIDLDLVGENLDFLDLSGSTLTFSASTSAPVPGVSNPWTTVGS